MTETRENYLESLSNQSRFILTQNLMARFGILYEAALPIVDNYLALKELGL